MNKPKTIRRAKHGESARFFLMARSTAQDKQLSWEAIGIMTYLLSKPDDWTIQPSDLQSEHCGRDKVYRILRELIAAGYLIREKRRNDKGRIEWGEYILYELPQTETPYTENQDMVTGETPYTEKPYTENPHTTEYRSVQETELSIHDTESRARAGAKAVQSSDTVPSSKRKKPTVEQEFRAAWNEHAAVGNALRAAFGDDFVPAENCPRANLERYLEAAQQLGAAGCKPEDVESLHTYVKRRAKSEEWSVKFGPLALARHYTDYLKARKNAEERRQQDAEIVIVPVSMERQPFGPARERIAS